MCTEQPYFPEEKNTTLDYQLIQSFADKYSLWDCGAEEYIVEDVSYSEAKAMLVNMRKWDRSLKGADARQATTPINK